MLCCMSKQLIKLPDVETRWNAESEMCAERAYEEGFEMC